MLLDQGKLLVIFIPTNFEAFGHLLFSAIGVDWAVYSTPLPHYVFDQLFYFGLHRARDCCLLSSVFYSCIQFHLCLRSI